MSNYYSDDTALSKKEKLGKSLEAISTALDTINGITVSDTWKCNESETIHNTLEELKAKITTIKSVISSYEEFLVGTNKTYSDVAAEINASLSTFNKEE